MQKRRILIGLCGQARSGKDTVAYHLVCRYRLIRRAFADPIKEIVNDMFDWDERHSDGDLKEEVDGAWGFSPRQAYQRFGTEFARELNPNVWILMMQNYLKNTRGNYVISDVRFENEANWVRRNGLLLHVFREGCAKVNDHVSETPVPVTDSDLVVANNGTIPELYQAVDAVLKPHIQIEEVKPWQKQR